jgi:hypothetical protein
MELGTLDGILSCVAAGIGVTLLPKTVVENYVSRQTIRYHRLPPEIANVKTVFIHRSDTLITPALTAFISLARDQFIRVNEDTKIVVERVAPAKHAATNATKLNVHQGLHDCAGSPACVG